MTGPELDAVIAAMWVRLAPVAQERVQALERYVVARRSGGDAEGARVEAHAAAHKLAGALGTYGRPGSDVAGALEVLLSGPDPDAVRVAELVAELRTLVDA